MTGAPNQPSPPWEPGASLPEAAPGPLGSGWGPPPPSQPGPPGVSAPSGPPAVSAPPEPAGVSAPSGPPEHAAVHGGGNRGVAILLAATALIAALIAARASFVSSNASGYWQSALRTEVKRSAGALEDVRYLYQTELPLAVRILQARTLQAELQAAASGQTPAIQQALAIEVSVQAELLNALESSSDLATKPQYALPSGGLDLGKRLADLRGEAPDIVALDPDMLQATGDRQANKAQLLTFAELPIGAAALLGVLAEPFVQYRRRLLVAGTLAIAIGAALGIAVEALA